MFYKMDSELSSTALLEYTDDPFLDLIVLIIIHHLPYLQW